MSRQSHSHPLDRRAALERLGRERLDLLVVGGGVVGCGIALDAAARGLSAALVERDDFAAGTSSRSSKLVHGGLRYLERLDVRLVREALREQAVLLRIAPHLVAPLRFLYPLPGPRERLYVGAGLALYDRLGGRDRLLPAHRRLSALAAGRSAPGVLAPGGALEYWDCQVDDARLTLALARTAASLGAAVASRAEVVAIAPGGAGVAVRIADREGDAELEVRARHVVCAGGIWTEELARLAGVSAPVRLAPSKGVHLVLPRESIDATTAVITRTRESVLLVVPWGAHWLVGTTDTPWHGEEPVATDEDVDYLLGELNRIAARPVGRDEVVATYAGVRPLVAADGRRTSRLSREHAVVRAAAGVTVVAGGKLTTYRVVARDAVAAACGGTSRTETLPLAGADGFAAAWAAHRELARRHGLAEEQVERLVRRYGGEVEAVLAPAAENESLREPVPGAPGYLRAEVLYAATHEGALHVEDVLERRTHAAIETPGGLPEAAAATARLLGGALGWSEERVRREVDAYASASTRRANATETRSISSRS